MTKNYTPNMLEGEVTFTKKTITSKGHKYNTYFIYIPTNIALDSGFGYKPGDKARIRVDSKNRIIIEKI